MASLEGECEREHCSLPLCFTQGYWADFMKNLATNQTKRDGIEPEDDAVTGGAGLPAMKAAPMPPEIPGTN
ncbi:MAG: hypothetical protein ACN6OX_08250 [Pseudomonas sp.]